MLLSSGYIAGGAIAGVLIAFMAFFGQAFNDKFDLGRRLPAWWPRSWTGTLALGTFAVLVICLFTVGLKKQRNVHDSLPQGACRRRSLSDKSRDRSREVTH